MSNLLTSSRLRAWRDCRRKHRLLYIDGWRPVKVGDALRQGSLGHLALEAWWSTPDDRLGAAFRAMDGRAEDAYEQAAMEELLRAYDQSWAGEIARYEALAIEESFTAPLLNPDTGAASRTWLMAGKVDGVLLDRETGETLLLEHKLTSESFASDADTYWQKLGMDGQVSQYYVGAEALGHTPDACLYDVLRRPQLRVLRATPEESRKYRKDGTLYATQRTEDETPDEYRARVRADIEARPDHYFQRRRIGRTDADIIEYLGDIWAEGRMMREAELAGRAPRNPDSCHRFGTCPFWAVCAYGVQPEEHPDIYYRVADVHPELELETV